MEFTLVEINGVVNSIMSLRFSRRNYSPEMENDLRGIYRHYSNHRGFIDTIKYRDEINNGDTQLSQLINQLELVYKYGTGYGVNGSLDAGHETLLRFIDLVVVVRGLHRGAMDDLDSHAMRMNNRIVRSSTRTVGAYKPAEMSDWYRGKILTFAQVLDLLGMANDLPQTITSDNGDESTVFVKTPNGYIAQGLEGNADVQRGLYPLSIPMDCIFAVNLYDLHHIYMRRNKFTHASPELSAGIESLAEQVERYLPVLGKYVANETCYGNNGDIYNQHVMKVAKTNSPNRILQDNQSIIYRSDASNSFEGLDK